ncbi:adenylate/guanylate cyclase domain-containing protein [Mesorhizobium sp. L-8-10]|uniref:CHASE2 domain-containing protein n=1 Tax=Mesorhizobium sp. L-8-10 TaxID=2744523 RepID=UPI0019292B1B|nr:adenylate/guanylate cyclase domain-containing protein [Mesorhizobium sp. L-8-10]BCH30300.1 adenylate/guanylate cyclase domain-containing protein [Mesorhizobium sp. L-8-10]
MSRRTVQILIAVLLTGLWGAGLGFVHWRGDTWFLERVEATMADLRTLARGKKTPPDLVTIVAIDDEAVHREGGYPLARASLARIVTEIARHEPRVIAVDLLLVDAGPADGDEALATALRRQPSVIAAAAIFPSVKQRLTDSRDDPLARVPIAERFLLPQERFSNAAGVGVVNVATDRSGTPRAVPMLFRASGQLEASLPLRVAAAATGESPVIDTDKLWLGNRAVRTDIGQILPIDFYGPRGTIRTVSAATLLDGNVAPEAFKDRIVVIGATVTGGGDVFPTPFDPIMPGVEIISTAIAQLLDSGGIVRDRTVRLVDAGVATILPMILVALLAWRRSVTGFVAMLGVLLVWLALNFTAFFHGTWLSLALPAAAALPPLILFGAVQLWLDRRRASRFAGQSLLLQRVQGAGLERWLAQDETFLAEPLHLDAAVVFIDLSGFTGLSETTGPKATSDLLNGFYTLVDEEAARHHGVVTGFSGDGAMIVFGLPKPDIEDAAWAARFCVALAGAMKTWLTFLPAPVAARIGFKIGAHFGAIVASRLGGQNQQHVAVTGDTANVASRLMEVAAAAKAQAALSDDLLQAAGPECLAPTSLSGPQPTQIRGRSGSIDVWLWHGSESQDGPPA